MALRNRSVRENRNVDAYFVQFYLFWPTCQVFAVTYFLNR